MIRAALLPEVAGRAASADRPVWAVDGRDWPQRHASVFVEAGGVRWHVQQYGEGPEMLLLHGTAAATHSWRGLGPLLAKRRRVTAIDLPGHGFSNPPADAEGFTQAGMARAVGTLLRRLELAPEVVVGHSAGAALGAALCLDGWAAPRRLVSINGALSPRHAFSGALFPLMAEVASWPAAAKLFAARASAGQVERVIRSTGSVLDAEGVELYRRLFARPGHVSAAFAMMAGWSRAPVTGRLHRLPCPLTLLAAPGDRAIAPAEAEATRRRLGPGRAELVRLPAGGHLLHEEAPEQVAALILDPSPQPEDAAP